MVMTVLLTLTSMFDSLTDSTPRISYTTKLDNWMVICIIFVVFVLAELVIVLYLSNRPSREHLKVKPIKVTPKKAFILDGSRIDLQEDKRTTTTRLCCAFCSNVESADALDNITQILFFLALAIYNVYYWSDLLTS